MTREAVALGRAIVDRERALDRLFASGSASDAAVREAKEETSMDVELVCLLGVYSDPSRDPRGHTVSMIYVARAHGEPAAADDAASVGIFNPAEVNVPLAFDHAQILRDYLHYRETGIVPAIS